MRVFVTGGGTGGHLFPAIALGEELLERGYDVHLITDIRCSGYIKGCKLETHVLYLGFMRKGILSKILLSARMVHAIIKTLILLICYRPQVVIGFGGYTSFPALAAAKLLFIPIMLHEQNCFLGKVNDMFARSATKLALNFAETANLPTNIQDKIVVAGTPVRKDLRDIATLPSPRHGLRRSAETLIVAHEDSTVSTHKSSAKMGLEGGLINLLITGGSQAAQVFSEIIPAAVEIMHKKAPEIKISIVQQAKSESLEALRKTYKPITEGAEIEEFFHNMPERYIAADIAICRSGASTIAELIHTGTPAIMIPFPGAAEDHQTYNAKVIEAKGAGWVFAQSEITPEALADKIIELAKSPALLADVSDRLLSLMLPSERILGDAVEKIINS